MTSSFVEIAVARHFNYRMNLIIPNVYWGLGLSYEVDLLIVSPSGYATEVEIKVSKSDIKADLSKRHTHNSKLIKRFYFAVPESLADCEYLPKDAGLVTVTDFGVCKILRPPRVNKEARRLSEGQLHILRGLAAMRIWDLKESIARLTKRWK